MAIPRHVELIDRYRAARGVSESEVARRIGVSRENLRKWRVKGVSRLPDRENLAAVARVIGKPYREVISAALFDTGYLTDEQASTPRPHDEVLHDAIDVLTEATRLSNQPMRQTNSGQWDDPDPHAALRIDWAAFVTLALAGATANVCSVEQILAGRPGSWEAEMVRRTIEATVFDDKDLLRHRTDPITVDQWVEAVLARSADDTPEDDYQAAELALSDRQSAVPLPADTPPGPFSADDPRIAQLDWVSVDNDGNLAIASFLEWPPDYADKLSLHEEVLEEARNSRPTPLGDRLRPSVR